MSMASLPLEIMEKILVELPVGCLVKFRCVSKSWCCLIDSESFIDYHLKSASKTRLLIISKFLAIYDKNPERYTKMCCLPSFLYGDDGIQFPPEERTTPIQLVGYCHGLFCIRPIFCRNISFLIWNPSTRQIKSIVGAKFEKNARSCLRSPFSGFGFDETSKDYKFVLSGRDTNDIDGSFTPVSMVYSFKSNSWKYIEIKKEFVERVSDFGTPSYYLKGKLYWLTIIFTGGGKLGRNLVMHDLYKEKFKSIQLPMCYVCWELSIIEDQLWLMCRPEEDVTIELHVLRRREDEEGQWEKVLKFNCHQLSVDLRGLYPIHITQQNNTTTLVFVAYERYENEGYLITVSNGVATLIRRLQPGILIQNGWVDSLINFSP